MKHLTHKIGLTFGTLALVALISAPAFAEGSTSQTNAETSDSTSSTATVDSGSATSTEGSSHSSGSSSDTSTSDRMEAEGRLTGTKLTLCENHKDAIESIMSRIADRGQKQVDLFTTIATRVETFYTNSGKTVSSYSTLVADVNAKHTAAQAAVAKIKADSTTFTCSITNPQSIVTGFKSDLKLEISALQAYRTSVRNLTVAVKSVVEDSSAATTGSNQ
ncbi:MAG: hypothetical protein ACREBW_08190 [Candidatus Micrarchaeaceae archaeon]